MNTTTRPYKNCVHTSLLPMYYCSKVLGGMPFRLVKGEQKPRWSPVGCFCTLAFLALHVFAVYVYVSHARMKFTIFKENDKGMNKFSTTTQVILTGYTIITICISVSFFNLRKLQNFVYKTETLLNSSNALHVLDGDALKKNLFRKYRRWLAELVIFTIGYGSIPKFKAVTSSTSAWHHSMLTHIAELQFRIMCELLRLLFKMINTTIENCRERNRDISALIRKARLCHTACCELQRDAGKLAEPQNLILLICFYTHFAAAFYIFAILFSGEIKKESMLAVEVFFVFALRATWLGWDAHSTTQEARRTSVLLGRLFYRRLDVNTKAEIRIFLRSMTCTDMEFSIYNSIRLDMGSLSKILLGTITIVLVQLQRDT